MKLISYVHIFIVQQYVVFVCLLAVAACYPQYYEEKKEEKKEEEKYEPPKYEFKYAVEDKHTGDYKEQSEVADGKTIKVLSYALSFLVFVTIR